MRMPNINLRSNVHCQYWSVAELLPREELERLQFGRVVEQVNYLWEKSGFYRQKWQEGGFSPTQLKTLEDIRRIPLLKKEEIRISQEAEPPYGMMQVPGCGPISRIAMTSGTTGEPVLIPFTEEDYFRVFCSRSVTTNLPGWPGATG